MANDTDIVNSTASAGTQNLSILEPYVDNALLEQLSTMDPVLVSGGIVLISFILATLALAILKIVTAQVARRTKTELDDKLVGATQQPVFRVIILGGFYLAVLNLGLENAIVDILLKVVVTLGYLVIIRFVLNALDIVVNHGVRDLAKKTDSALDDEIIPILHKAAMIVVWAFGLILILGAWGVDVGPFLAGLGIAGLAISFALQNTLSNVFAGISLILDRTFKLGDKIELSSGEVGTIYDVSLRSTRVRTYDNEIIIIPNSSMASSKIKNFTQPDLKVRVAIPFSVEYGNKPEEVINLIKSTAKKEVKGIMKEPEVNVLFTEMADSSLNFKLLFWVERYDEAYGKKIEATDLIYKTLKKAKIGIPFPTQTIHLKK